MVRCLLAWLLFPTRFFDLNAVNFHQSQHQQSNPNFVFCDSDATDKMAKAKRMSDIFASSAEKSSSAPAAAATPYSSEGPTLPIIPGADGEHTEVLNKTGDASTCDGKKKRELGGQKAEKDAKTAAPTFDHVLYEAWNLLSPEILRIVISNERLRPNQNTVPIVFTKNQNIKTGINRLKTYLGAYVDKHQPMDLPEALKQADTMIAVSAQGEGTAKLVSIVDMVRRIVAPGTHAKPTDGKLETWYMYASLTSVEVEKVIGPKATNGEVQQDNRSQNLTTDNAGDEEEAFEPMEVDAPAPQQEAPKKQTRRDPVLTIWMTKKSIPAFKKAFGEQTFEVQSLPKDD
jgi:hypothetical protein